MPSSVIIPKDSITPVNSTTYVDILGLEIGLERFPGETSAEFLRRIQRSTEMDLTSTYEGLLNRLNLEFGLEPQILMEISDVTGFFRFTASISGIILTNETETIHVQTREVDPDAFWTWKTVGQIVQDINRSTTFQAVTSVPDIPAVQIVRQNNAWEVRNMPVTGSMFAFPEYGVEEDSILFSNTVPDYVFGGQRRNIVFDSIVPAGTNISYRYRRSPYEVIGYPASLLSLSDPDLVQAAAAPDGRMIYQIREYLYRVAEQDRSYWGN